MGKSLYVNNGLPIQCFVCSEPSDTLASMVLARSHTRKDQSPPTCLQPLAILFVSWLSAVVKWFSEGCQLSATGSAKSTVYLLPTKVVGIGFLIGCQLFRDGSRIGCGPIANFVANNAFRNLYSLVERAAFPEQKKMVANFLHSTLPGSPISMAVQIVCIYKVAEHPRNI